MKTSGTENEFMAGTKKGLFYVKAYDKKKPEEFTVYSAINIIQPKKSRISEKLDNLFDFKVKVVDILFAPRIRKWQSLNISCNCDHEGTIYTLDINALYPAFIDAETKGTKALQDHLTRLLINQYILIAYPKISNKDAFERAMEIYHSLLA